MGGRGRGVSRRRHRSSVVTVTNPRMDKVLAGVDASRRAAFAMKYAAEEETQALREQLDAAGLEIGRLNRNRQDTQSIANPNSSAGRQWERMTDRQKKNAHVYEEDTFGSERKNRRKP